MKTRILFVFLILLLYLNIASAQEAAKQADTWMRVQSNNGEFSIEIPKKYNFLFDKDGFIVSDRASKNYQLTNMSMANAYTEKTLLSFEVYEATKNVVDILYKGEKKEGKSSEINRNGVIIKQVIKKTSDFYSVSQFFASKKYVYVLTAASREGETPIIKRFLDSLVFKTDANAPLPNAILISSLKTSNVELVTKDVIPFQPGYKSPKDNDLKPIAVVAKSEPSYVDSARMRAVQGKMQLRCTFSEDGFMNRIEFINMLPEGLTRQVLFAALRVKFLPQEKKGIPQTVQKVIEYQFTLY